MAEYIVTWSIPVEADSPEDAVRQAVEILQDPENTATFFLVENEETGEEIFKDFEEDLKGGTDGDVQIAQG